MKNIFIPEVTNEVIARIHTLSPESKAAWGKMSIDKMLAHCNVAYELVYEDKHPKPNVLMKFIIKLVAKDLVVNEKPYKKSAMTSPAFLIKDERNFEKEKIRLIDYIKKTQQLGESYFDKKESHSFGVLTKNEWNNMFYKHLDHHITQFGA